eukprot:7636071-Ditylum_brightwellii.AAC.1
MNSSHHTEDDAVHLCTAEEEEDHQDDDFLLGNKLIGLFDFDEEKNEERSVDFDIDNIEITSSNRRSRNATMLSFPSPMASSSRGGDNNAANYFDDTKGEVYASNTVTNSATRKGGRNLLHTISSFQLIDMTDTAAKLAAQLQ